MPASLRIEIFPSDLQRMIDFYSTILNFSLIKRDGDYAYLGRRHPMATLGTEGFPTNRPRRVLPEDHNAQPKARWERTVKHTHGTWESLIVLSHAAVDDPLHNSLTWATGRPIQEAMRSHSLKEG
ncbi:uncharacterized protein A1O5_00087 [Cladophialophora psammophila CBS 110553]|uniref:Glyoxalase/fosfomycin resistance/dioxygenase domain-containing protein n=1 Tax=Cladophialophora psammophila CBS 110553 TaxID=1182543 RepID=W9XF48_9EURO|nr:uncharacterized protein A1O5_00087 [Cladophialophora psammophila CBS 110553]EXJ75581.1 hypothetical protein A1O5_00087 [Cladophialophora psammophila CBS 110553]